MNKPLTLHPAATLRKVASAEILKTSSAELKVSSAELKTMSSALEAESVVLKPESTALKSESVGLKSESVGLKSESVALESESVALESESAALKPEPVGLKPKSTALKSESVVSKSESVGLKPKSTALKPESVGLKPESAVLKTVSGALKPASATNRLLRERREMPTRSESRLQRIVFLDMVSYLREWTEHTFGSPALFPMRSREHAMLRYYLSPRPEGVPPDSRRVLLRLVDEGKAPLQIAVPAVRWKPYSRYNYLPHRARNALRGCLQALFDITLWNDMEPHLYGLPRVVSQEVSDWCTRHGISVDNEAVVLKHYRMMQRQYALSGIPVRRKRAKPED